MKYKILLFLVATVFILSSCKDNSQFTIQGTITHAEGKTIYLEQLLVSSIKPVGETKIDKNGKFKFNGQTGIPTFYLLKLSDQNFITLLIDSAETITIEADAANLYREYNVSGSLGSSQVRELSNQLKNTQQKLDSLQSLNDLYKGNPDYNHVRPLWSKEYDKIVEEQINFSTNFVKKNPFSMASVVALYQKFNNNDSYYIVHDVQAKRTAASALHSIYPQSEQVKALYNHTLQQLKEQKALEVQKLIEEQGENSPDITLPNTEGKEVALSSLRGKVVLLQFWSALNRDSRIQNQALVEAYKKYKRKGFEIYQVSIDKNRIDWVDAIDKDKLTWTNVGDMEGSILATKVYNIQYIPSNYLLDKEGSILAKNLKGPALNKALAQILK